jgi:uncharacterized membrane protein
MPNQFAGPDQDPVMTQFDRLIAFIVYVLLFIGVFTFGVPSIVGLALALAHGHDTHPILRTHYRHQVRIFWMGAFCIVGAVVAGFAGSGVWLAALVTWGEKISGVSTATIGVSLTGQQAWIGGVMLATSVSLVLFGAAWTLLQSLFGFLRLAGNRPIGHTPVA